MESTAVQTSKASNVKLKLSYIFADIAELRGVFSTHPLELGKLILFSEEALVSGRQDSNALN
jgi:hypothetical protein